MSDTLQIQQSLKDNIDYVLSKDNITIFFPPESGQYKDQDVTVDLDQVLSVPLLAAYDNSEMILNLLKENRKFTVDEEKKLVTVHMNTRTTIMLRDIPESTNQEDVKKLFGEFSSFIVDMKPEIGDNYLVDFKTADITQNAFVYVRQQTFNGKSIACCIKSNYNYYTPQYYFPPQENNTIFFDYSKDYDENKRGRGRGRGKKYQNGGGVYRGNTPKTFNNNTRRNESPKVVSQDLGSEYFPPLSPNFNKRNMEAEKKHQTDQQSDIVKGTVEVNTPEWDVTSMETGKSVNNEWNNKKGNQSNIGETNQENSQGNDCTEVSKQEITAPTTTLCYADIVKQNVEKAPQTKSSNASFNVYKGSFSVAAKEPKIPKTDRKLDAIPQDQPLVNPTN